MTRTLGHEMKSFLLIVLSFFLISCDEGDIKPVALPIILARDVATQTSFNTKMSFSTAGIVRAVLGARRVQTFETKHYTQLDSNMKVDFFGQDGKHSSILSSHWARIDDITHNMTAYDSVRIKSDSGVFVETDSLLWNNATKIIHSDAFVRITEKNGRITTGHGFESDQDLIRYRILYPTIVTPANNLEQMNATPNMSSPTNTPTSILPPPTSPPSLPKKDSN